MRGFRLAGFKGFRLQGSATVTSGAVTHVAYASRACCRILGSTEVVAAVVPAQQTGPLCLVSQSASETQQSQNPNEANLGYCPHTVTVYNRATIKVLIYLYYGYYPTVTKWGQYFSHLGQHRCHLTATFSFGWASK